jgi:hypothetical protein
MKNHCALLILLLLVAISKSQVITVGPSGDYPSLNDAETNIAAGDTVMILDGVYDDGTQHLDELHGTANEPIVIMAHNEHAAIFQGGTTAIHLTNCSFLKLNGLVIEQQNINGINIDDGGDYTTPTHHITVRNCIFRDMAGTGNNDLLKLSGLDDFLIVSCEFVMGSPGGSGIDMVGCHYGVIEDNLLDQAGSSGIQAKGGSQYIRIERNIIKNVVQRGLNLGGSTGLQYFRPPLPDPITDAFEAADIDVISNIFIGNWAPIAYVGCIRVRVVNNTIYQPDNWVLRILQETTNPGFLPCSQNEFRNNIVYLSEDITEVNIGPETEPASFIFTNNLWFNESNGGWTPGLPVIDSNQVIADPLFTDPFSEDFSIASNSPAVMAGIKQSGVIHDYVQHSFYDPPSIGAFEGHEAITSVPYHIRDHCILIGPNPTNNSVTIDGDFDFASIEILDSGGMLVQELSDNMPPVTIDLSSLPNGLYFLRIQSSLHLKMEVISILKMN